MNTTKLEWYQFRQNNSGGSFTINEDVDINVLIQANSASEANEIAPYVGIYFNGVNDELDCECCGDRWYKVYNGDGTEYPMVYDEQINNKTAGVKLYPYGSIEETIYYNR